MTTFQPITKQDLREMNSSFSSICTEEKSKSTSPTSSTRKIFRAKRRGNTLHEDTNNRMNHPQNMKDPDEKFKTMNAEQFMKYQQESMTKRMKRKRKFDVFSSGSNSSLHSMLQSSNTFRVPYHSMFYVRVNVETNHDTKYTANDQQTHNNHTNQPQQEEKSNDNISQSQNAFDLMTKSSKAMSNQNWKYAESQLNLDENENHNDMNDDDDDDQMMIDNNDETKVFYPVHEECLITRSVRVCSEWVEAYNQYEIANNIAWRKFNVDGKVHEYQINRSGGVVLINLDESQQQIGDKMEFLKENEGSIKQWVLDHGYSGFIINGSFYFYQPHLYWNLLDDNKRSKVKQTLISDMFQSTKTKPNNAPWKCTFSL